MRELLNGLIGDASFLLRGLVGVLAIWFVVWSWVRTRSIVPTVGAVLLGGIVMWGVANLNTVRDEVGEDLENHGAGDRRVVVEAPGWVADGGSGVVGIVADGGGGARP
jgi:hypothetical protein